jgi:hypothetical protein
VGHHSSRTRITPCLKQPTRGLRPGRPQTPSYLVLLRAGFTELAASLRQLVGSYPTVAPFPSTHFIQGCPSSPCGSSTVGEVSAWRYIFCGTFPGSLLLGVTQRPALRSPDFPPCTHFDWKRLTWIASIPSKWVQGDGLSNSQRGDTYSAAGSQCIPKGGELLGGGHAGVAFRMLMGFFMIRRDTRPGSCRPAPSRGASRLETSFSGTRSSRNTHVLRGRHTSRPFRNRSARSSRSTAGNWDNSGSAVLSAVR